MIDDKLNMRPSIAIAAIRLLLQLEMKYERSAESIGS